MANTVINIARDFSRYPAGRYLSDGPYSGEKFRDEFLIPAIESGKHVVIEFDGARGYGSSFLEEAFGGCVRKGYTPERVLASFEFVASDASIVDEITDYIKHARDGS